MTEIILAFSASNSKDSINRKLVELAIERYSQRKQADTQIEFLDLNYYEMPIYSIDRERTTGIPELADEVYHKIGSADGVVVSFAEHNGTVTAAWKNIFDWMSRIETAVWQQKVLLLLAATPGKRAGAGVLGYAKLASFFGGRIAASRGIGEWANAYDADKNLLINTTDIEALDLALDHFSTALAGIE